MTRAAKSLKIWLPAGAGRERIGRRSRRSCGIVGVTRQQLEQLLRVSRQVEDRAAAARGLPAGLLELAQAHAGVRAGLAGLLGADVRAGVDQAVGDVGGTAQVLAAGVVELDVP